MKTNALLCAAISAIALTGCNTPAPKPTTSPPPEAALCPDSFVPRPDFCGTSLCSVAVQVVTDLATGKCVVLAGSSTLTMLPGNHPDPTPNNPGVLISFWLPANSQWEFRTEPPSPLPPFAAPVIFKTPNAQSQFSYSVVGPLGRAWIYDKNTDSTKYEYKLRVYHKTTNQQLDSLDPAIVNDAR